jgi:hypothetical protein
MGRRTFLRSAVFLDIPLEAVCRITGYRSEAVKAFYDIPESKKQTEMQKFASLRIS